MSILGSAVGRALAGGGAAVASLASKYIDEDLAQQRMQAHAELQRLTAKNIREDDDAFRNDPTRIARDRANRRDDTLATAATAREAELAGLNDTALQGAREGQKDREAAADTRRKVAGRKTELKELAPTETKVAVDHATAVAKAEGDTRAELQKKYGNDPLFLKAMRNEAQAKHVESAASVAQAELTRMKIADEKRLGELYSQLLSMPDSPESAKDRKGLEREIAIIKSRSGTAGDKSEKGPRVKEETEIGPDGKVINRKVTREGPAGSEEQQQTPAAKIAAGVERARASGKIGDAIAELRKMGASPAQILQAGVTEDELKAASQPTRRPLFAKAEDRAATIESMDDRTLRKIAAIEGHVHQRDAKRELARREAEQEPVDTSGIGFGGRSMSP